MRYFNQDVSNHYVEQLSNAAESDTVIRGIAHTKTGTKGTRQHKHLVSSCFLHPSPRVCFSSHDHVPTSRSCSFRYGQCEHMQIFGCHCHHTSLYQLKGQFHFAKMGFQVHVSLWGRSTKTAKSMKWIFQNLIFIPSPEKVITTETLIAVSNFYF